VLIGALLRLYTLGTWDFSGGEAWSVQVAAQSLRTIWTLLAREDPFHPPLSYMLLHFWMYLGKSEFTLRLLSVILGTLSIWLMYRIGTYLRDRRTGLLAALILAISPFHIWHSQEARMYELLFLLSLASLDALVRLIREDRPLHWVAYVGATSLSLYTDYGAFLILAAHNLAVAALLFFKRGPRPWKWMLAQAVVAALYLPWAQAFLGILFHLGPVPTGETSQGPRSLAPGALRSVGSVLATFISASLPAGQPLLKLSLILVFGAVCLVGLLALRQKTLSWVLLGSIAVVPILVGLVFSAKTTALFPRTLSPASAGYYLFLAAGFLAVPRRLVGSLLLTGLIGVNMVSLNLMYHHTEKSAPWRKIAAHIASKVRGGEGIVFVDGAWVGVFSYYYRGPAGVDTVDYESRADFPLMRELVNTRRVLYLVLKDERRVDPGRRVRTYIQSRFTLTATMEFPGGVVVEQYQRSGETP